MPNGWLSGFERALLFFVDSSGYAIGQSSTLANGSTSGAYVADEVKTAGLAPVNITEIQQQAGDRIKNTVQYGNGKIGGFDLVLSDWDTTLMTMITGSTLNTANTKATLGSDNPNKSKPTLLGLALQQRYTQDDGSDKYFTRIFPRCQMRWRQSGLAFQGESDVIIRVTPLMTTKAITGQTFGSAAGNLAFSLEADQTDNYFRITDNPFHILTQRSDAAATAVTAIYKPLSTVVTLNQTPNEMHKNATATALSAVTLAGAITLAAAGTAGDTHVMQIETAYVPV